MFVSSRPTLRDVASLANVSIATVSRVLNGVPAIRPDTEARVRAAMSQLGFRPNGRGRELRSGQSCSVGVLLPSLANPVFADNVAGIQEAARAAGWAVLITCSDYDPGREAEAVDALIIERAAGLILTVADSASNRTLNLLDNEHVPYVLLHNESDRADRPSVAVDNGQAGRDAADALIAQGHRRLAMVAGRFAASDRSRLRHAGFMAAVEDAALPAPALIEIDFTDDIAPATLRAAFLTAERPTGIFCSNDLLALRTIAGLRALGLAVPRDVSVIGMDGIEVGQLVEPSLASIMQPAREMGRRAFLHLLARLKDAAPPAQIRLPHQCRPGRSLGAVPSPQE
jgi:DNA-binding LacI/PurR family transcriptional regulator